MGQIIFLMFLDGNEVLMSPTWYVPLCEELDCSDVNVTSCSVPSLLLTGDGFWCKGCDLDLCERFQIELKPAEDSCDD